MKRVAVYGGSFDPPGAHRREIARQLAERFDDVVIVPYGPRPDKPSMYDSPPIHRAVMADLTFRHLPRVRVDLFDLEEESFTQPHALESRYRAENSEVWHVVPSDLIQGGKSGESDIQSKWDHGQELWTAGRFVVLRPTHEQLDPADLPSNSEVLDVTDYVPSVTIRNLVFNHQPVDEYVVPEVASYMRRHRLYRPALALRESTYRPAAPRFRLLYDEANPRAAQVAGQLKKYESDDPELVVVLGGDGTMLRAIRSFWRDRLPFFGLNLGHVGFLLNEINGKPFWEEDLSMYQLPLMRVEVELLDGERHRRLAFNDAWVERATGQTAWLKVSVNGRERLSRVVADGMLVSTAAGSTSYARAMGATPMPFNTRVLLLVGSNVLSPRNWQPAVMPMDAEVEITTLDADKRPLQAYVDGVFEGKVQSLKVRASHIAAVEVAFRPGHDPATKLAEQQFRE